MKKNKYILALMLLSSLALSSCGHGHNSKPVDNTLTTESTNTTTEEILPDISPVETDHSFLNPTYTWNSSNSKVTAERKCNEGDHVERETVDTTYTTAVTDKVVYSYTSKAFTNTSFTIQTKEVEMTIRSIKIDSSNSKTKYLLNEPFSQEGIKVYVVCSNLEEFEIDSTKYSVDYSSINPAEDGTYKVKVTYLTWSNTYKVAYSNTGEFPWV